MLHRGTAAQSAVWLTVLGVHVEVFLLAAGFALVLLLVPDTAGLEPLEWLFGEQAAESDWMQPALVGLQHLCALLVAPFYVATGFCLYLNRRTQLEGWDIELGFRRMAAEARDASPSHRSAAGRAAGLAGTLVSAAAAAATATLLAAEPAAADELDRDSARASIEEILAGPAFHEPQTIRIPRLILDWRPLSEDSEYEGPRWEWLALLASSTEVILIAVGLALVAFLILSIARERRRMAALRDGGPPSQARPERLVGLRVARDSLPKDVIGEASALWRAGRARDALALLYRASLSRLMTGHAVEFLPSFTEGDCLRAALPRLPEECGRFFAVLSRSWQRCAYGARIPSDADFEGLCAGWTRHFERHRGGDSDGG